MWSRAMKLRKLVIQGFRAFNTRQEMVFDTDLCLVYGQNSHGKTSLAEALEFLFCGTTSRRELVASSKQEYSKALRNVHLDDEQEVYVEAEIQINGDQTIHIRRILEADYPAANAPCQSKLTKYVSGRWEAFTFSEIGLPDFESPESTPIIFQHTLRYVSHAPPSDRRSYFRRLLNVDDLYTLRDIVRNANSAHSLSCSDPKLQDLLDRISALVDVDDFDGLRGLSEGLPSDSLALGKNITAVMRGLLEADGIEVPEGVHPVAIADIFRSEIKDRRARRFNSQILNLPQLGHSWVAGRQWDTRVKPLLKGLATAQKQYESDNDVIDQQIEALKEFYSAGVGLDEFQQPFTEAKQCPFCLTDDIVTQQRITSIRETLEKPEKIQNVRNQLARELGGVEQLLVGIKSEAESQVNTELGTLRIDDVKTYMPDQMELSFADWHKKLLHLRRTRSRLLRVLELAINGLQEMKQQARNGTPVSLGKISKYKVAILREIQAFLTARNAYIGKAPEICDVINKAIDQLDKREQWSALLDISKECGDLYTALIEHSARQALKTELDNSYRKISDAVGQVLVEDKYPALSKLISEWWMLLRPDEPVNFKEVKPQGTGQRLIDIKASIDGTAGGADIERDAVAVFSDSQLNCLGLSMFLARCELDNFGLIIFDDPIQSLDKDHEYLFISEVVEKLLGLGIQVMVFTHSRSFWSDLQARHAARLPKGFKVVQETTPTISTNIHAMDSEIADLLKRIDSIVRNPDADVALSAANQIRSAAELFCKLMICKNESSDDNPLAPSVFDGKMLPELLRKAEPHLIQDPSHAGKIRHIESCTCRGSHHDYGTDPRVSLRSMLGDVRSLSREYGML